MKPILRACVALSLVSLAKLSGQNVTISVSSSMQPLSGTTYGYNNNEAFAAPWTTSAYQQVAANTYASFFRYPGGTIGNYWNWETGAGYAPTNKSPWRIEASRNTYDDDDDGPVVPLGAESGATPNAYSTGSNSAGSDLYTFITGLEAINASRSTQGLPPAAVVYMANIGTSASYVVPDLTHQLDALEVLDSAGLFPTYIQMGNELFIDDAFPDYTDMFPSAEEYADRTKAFVLAIRQRFPGRAFKWGIPIVKNVQPVGSSPDGERNTTWARRTLTRLAQSPNPLLPHGITFHYYTTAASNGSPATVFADVFTRYNAANWLTYFPLPDSTRLNGTTDIEGDGRTEQDVRLWVTEWGQANQSSNPTGDQWFYALVTAGMGLLQLESPRLEISSPHVLFANSSWSHLQTTAPYARQNLGWGSYAINRASLGKTEARKLTFSPNPSLSGYPTFYGWEFSNSGQSNRHYVFLNLGSTAQTVATSGLGVSQYEILSRPATTLVNGTDQDFVNAGGLVTGTLGSSLSVPAYSIVRLYGPQSPVASITVSDGTAAEPSNNGQFTVTLSPAPSATVTVNLARSGSATNGTDYTSIPTTVNVGTGGSTTINVTVTNDSLYEGNEVVTLTLASGTGYTVGSPSAATVTIADDEGTPVATITASDSAAAEPSNDGQFTVSLSPAPQNAISVGLATSGSATSGSDYTALPTSVSVGSSGSATVAVDVTDDTAAESSETVVYTVQSSANYTTGTPSAATVTIADNDTALPTVTVSATDSAAAEPAATGTFTFTRTGSTAAALTVNYAITGTATAGSDYTSLGTSVNIPAGSASTTRTVTPIDDSAVESAETVILTLSTNAAYTVGTPSGGTVTIADNDSSTPVTVTFTSQSANDGYVTESTETSNVGGANAAGGTGSAALRVGDTATDQQVRTIVSFDTSPIPDGATVTAVTLRLQRGSLNGTNPFSTHGQCRVDIRSGAFGAVGLENSDFEAAADAVNVGQISDAPANGDWASGALGSTAYAWINRTGTTQFRVYFQTDDNNDNGRDDMGFFPGEGTAGTQPELIVTYTP